MAARTGKERLLTFLLLPAIVGAVLVLTGVTFGTSFQQERLRQRSVVEATLSLANEKAARLSGVRVGRVGVLRWRLQGYATRSPALRRLQPRLRRRLLQR